MGRQKGVTMLKASWNCKACGTPYWAKDGLVREGMCESCYRREYSKERAKRKAAAELGVESLKASAVCVVCRAEFTYIVRRYLGLEPPVLCRRHRKQAADRRYRMELTDEEREKRAEEKRKYKYAWARCGVCRTWFKYQEGTEQPKDCPDCRPQTVKWDGNRLGTNKANGGKMFGIPLGLYGVIHNPLNPWDCRVLDLKDLQKLVQDDEVPIGMELMSRKGVGIRVGVDGLTLMGYEEVEARMEAWDENDDQTSEDGAEDEADEAVGVPGGARDGAGGDQRQRAQPTAFVSPGD